MSHMMDGMDPWLGIFFVWTDFNAQIQCLAQSFACCVQEDKGRHHVKGRDKQDTSDPEDAFLPHTSFHTGCFDAVRDGEDSVSGMNSTQPRMSTVCS